MTMRSYTAQELLDEAKLDPKIDTLEKIRKYAVRAGIEPQKRNNRNFWLFNEFDIQAINKYVNRVSARKISRDLQKSYPLPNRGPKIHPSKGWKRLYAMI